MTKKSNEPQKIYYVREERGRYYVYCLQYAPVETLFHIAISREDAEQAIRDHKEGKHNTQESYK
jgi:hypothetical protein